MFSRNMLERIKGVKEVLMETRNLGKKIKTLDTERANLMIEIEKLKKMAESKINALENEVSIMREEVKSLRELLGYSKETRKQ
ncbi:hypothetical protein KAU55_01845 [Candidatus Bathyarchaeota archaeon]|nr:hypothetical protein [Candidatus Bathyarchaeota archaeon]